MLCNFLGVYTFNLTVKKTLFFLVLYCTLTIANAQQWYYQHGSGNPNGLNTENDQNGIGNGWTVIQSDTANSTYTPVQNIPFAFNFEGSPVTKYKVSTWGYLTFTDTAKRHLFNKSVSLPSLALPDKTVSIQGFLPIGENDAVLTKVFGQAPNRQLWIKFYSMTSFLDSATWSSFSYMSIVLEETTNRIFVVSQAFGSSVKPFVSAVHNIGIKSNDANGLQASSVNATDTLLTSNPSDNTYYEFLWGTQKTVDASLKGISWVNSPKTPGSVVVNTNSDLLFEITNPGKTALTDIQIAYTINGGPILYDTVAPFVLAPNSASVKIQKHKKTFSGNTAGSYQIIKAWIAKANGGADLNFANDTIIRKVLFISGNAVAMPILMEKSTAAWNGYCPDADFVSDSIKRISGVNVIITNHHNLDAMAGAGDSINTDFNATFPSAMFNRQSPYKGIKSAMLPQDSWLNALKLVNTASPVKTQVHDLKLDVGTRKMTWKVKVGFADYMITKDVKVGTFVNEAFVRGIGTGYEQSLAASIYTNAKHPLYNKGSVLRGYYHNDVCWSSPSGVYGQPLPTLAEVVGPNDSFEFDFGYTFTSLNDSVSIPTAAQYGPKGMVFSKYKPASLSAIGFVSINNANPSDRILLGASQRMLWDTKLATEKNQIIKFSMFPNPSSGKVEIQFQIVQPTQISLHIYDLAGKECTTPKVWMAKSGLQTVPLATEDLQAGIYLVQISTQNGSHHQQKLVVAK
jgi:hypothetical protein